MTLIVNISPNSHTTLPASSLLGREGDDVEGPLVGNLHIFLEVVLDAIGLLFVHDPLVHPQLNFVVVVPDLDSDAVHGVSVPVLGAD